MSAKSTDNVYNVVSKALLLPDAAKEFLDQEKLGRLCMTHSLLNESMASPLSGLP